MLCCAHLPYLLCCVHLSYTPFLSGSDMTCPDFSGTSPFHLAIEENATTCLMTMLRFLPKEILEIPDSQFQVPLVHAVQANNLDICQILIQGGANVNSVDQTTRRTPLHFAAETAYGPMIELLLRSGGLLDIPDADGLTPIHIASIVDSQDALNAIVKVVGSEVLNLQDMRGLTPLMHACIYGNEGNVKLLLKKKVGLQIPRSLFCFLLLSLLVLTFDSLPV